MDVNYFIDTRKSRFFIDKTIMIALASYLLKVQVLTTSFSNNFQKTIFLARPPPCRNGQNITVGATGPSSPVNGNHGMYSRSKFDDSSNSSSPKPAFVTSDFAGCCGGQYSNGSGKYQTSVTNGRQDRQVVQVKLLLSLESK